jgi:chemotaxis receptor (MCP) glutamine deamidase CheD
LDGVEWNNKGMNARSIGDKNIECITDHLSSFTMVVLNAEVYGDNKENL